MWAGGCSRHCCGSVGACFAPSSGCFCFCRPDVCRISRLAQWLAEGFPPCFEFAYVFPRCMMPAGYLTAMLAMPRPARKASPQKCRFPCLTQGFSPPNCAPTLPRRLMVRHRFLIPFIEVRVLAGHPLSDVFHQPMPKNSTWVICGIFPRYQMASLCCLSGKSGIFNL